MARAEAQEQLTRLKAIHEAELAQVRSSADATRKVRALSQMLGEQQSELTDSY